MSYLNRDARREVIVLAAMRVALRDGFSAMTVRQIASEAGVSPATIYLYFENKEDMIKKLFIHVKERMGHSYFAEGMEMTVAKGTFRSIYLNHYQYIILFHFYHHFSAFQQDVCTVTTLYRQK